MGNKDLALVVQRADNSIQRIKCIGWRTFFFRRIANLSAGLVARAPTLNQLKELRPPPDGTYITLSATGRPSAWYKDRRD